MLNKHEDDRRIIYDWSQNTNSKALIIKIDSVLGNHYHKYKDEEFFLLQGKFKELYVEGEIDTKDQPAPCYVYVPRGKYHRFVLEAGSILLGTATMPFDVNDEHKE